MMSTEQPGLGDGPVQGWHCEVPGLVVLFKAQQVRLTHLDSGHYLGAFPDPDAARGAADAVAHLCDWTMPVDELGLDRDAVDFLAHAMDVYGANTSTADGALPDFDFFWSRPDPAMPPTDVELLLAAPGWSCGVDGLAVAYAAHQLRLVHLRSGRAMVSFPTVATATAVAPFLLPLVAPHGWTCDYSLLAGNRSLWTAVASAAAVAGGGPDVCPTGELPEPELRCQVLRPAWSTCHDELAVVLASGGLFVAERVTGEAFPHQCDTLGQARRLAARLAAELDDARLTPASWAATWRHRQGVDAPLGPHNLRA